MGIIISLLMYWYCEETIRGGLLVPAGAFFGVVVSRFLIYAGVVGRQPASE